jgi:hypothetical protein
VCTLQSAYMLLTAQLELRHWQGLGQFCTGIMSQIDFCTWLACV